MNSVNMAKRRRENSNHKTEINRIQGFIACGYTEKQARNMVKARGKK